MSSAEKVPKGCHDRDTMARQSCKTAPIQLRLEQAERPPTITKGKEMEITNNNGHEETPAEENEPLYPGEFESMKFMVADSLKKIQEMEEQATATREQHTADIRDMEAKAEREREEWVRTRDLAEHRHNERHERNEAQRERLQALLDEIRATDIGEAYEAKTNAEAQVTHANERAERARQIADQALTEKVRALASVEGGDDIHPEDPRVRHIWRRASRIASANGFCQEYDKIASGLGLPELEFDYSGDVSVRVSAYVSIPVSGQATREDIANNDIADQITTDDIIENLDRYTIEWEIDEVNVELEED